MYVSQTAVTQQIKALEEQLGVSLFERTKKKVVLTPAGNVFLQEATLLLKRMQTAIERTREAPVDLSVLWISVFLLEWKYGNGGKNSGIQ